MRNRNKRIIFFSLFSIIIFTALFSGVKSEAPEKSSEANSKLKILIFSKYVKLLKTAELDSIELIFPNGSDIEIDGKRVNCKKLSLSYADNSFILKGDSAIIKNSNLIIYPKKVKDVFWVELNEEKRTYPLPLFIYADKNLVEFSIEEDADQYAIDSAWSELRPVSEQNIEALYALAYIIKARSELPYLRNKHKGYDFCDLTCCQTYGGLSGKSFSADISVKTDSKDAGLFFHSSSGGRLFSEYIFNNMPRIKSPPKDIIFSEKFVLSRNNFIEWEASISEIELNRILYKESSLSLKNISYDIENELIFIQTNLKDEVISPESFRIKINRIKGWNFIKSNNYVLTRKGEDYIFKGSGLGHGVGMSLKGAVQLAERGYSRYEILEHYYPDIQYTPDNTSINRFQYIVFDYNTGETIGSNLKDSFRNRVIPCGSIFKLFAAIYLAYERTDLFYNYIYTCTDKQDDKAVPKYCWNRKGHGRMNLVSALSHSCNKYFASLHRNINQDDFNRWLSEFIADQGIELHMRAANSKSDFSSMLAGLNFDVTITVEGLMKLNRFLYTKNREHASERFSVIFNALHKTFIDGTAKDDGKSSQLSNEAGRLWGKTGTVIAGTNNHYGYGIFTGGSDSVGIVSILRKGTGANSAKESKKILLNLQ